jgi:vitamin B12 transporter
LTVRAQGGRAFKAPTFSELFANTPFEVGDPTLQPERAASWEVGVEQRLMAGRLQLSGAWFTQRFRNLIQYAGAEPGQPTYGNISAATSRGGELAARAFLTPRLDLGLQASYTRTRVTEAGAGSSPAWLLGEPLLRRPEFAGSAMLRWRFSPGTSGRLDIHHLGGRDDVDFREFPASRVRLPARTLTDLAVTARLARGVNIAGRVENLFGQAWQQVVGFPARGRTLSVTLSAGR